MKVTSVSSKHIEVIENSIEGRRLISISYIDSKGVPSVRTVEPYEIKENGLFFAYCRVKNGIRAFKLNRVQSVDQTSETFNPRY